MTKIREITEFNTNDETLLLEIMEQNLYFAKLAGERYEQNQGRVKLLRDILRGIEHSKKEELMQKIYQYGSMLKSQDLIARQFFLWLLEIAERREQ